MTPLTDSEIAEMERLYAERESTEDDIDALETAGDMVHFAASEAFEDARDRLGAALYAAAPQLLASAREANRLRAQVETLREALTKAKRPHSLQCLDDNGWRKSGGHPFECYCGAEPTNGEIEKALSSTAPDDAGGQGGAG